MQGIKFCHISLCSMTQSVIFFYQSFSGEFIETAFLERWGSFWKEKVLSNEEVVFMEFRI